MEISLTPFDGLKIVQLKIYHDNRGFFVERFNKKLLRKGHTNYDIKCT